VRQHGVLHLMSADKFLADFIRLVQENFHSEQHLFLIYGDTSPYPELNSSSYVQFMDDLPVFVMYRVLFKALYTHSKIMLHGLFVPNLVRLLSWQPWLLKKCYWVMWGGDLYCYRNERRGVRAFVYELNRHIVIKYCGNLVTYVPGDVELARKWYGAKGKYHECLMYPSNLYKSYELPIKQGNTINFLAGNSGNPSNHHFELFDKLDAYKNRDIKIYCPLSYGDPSYIQSVVRKGNEMFGERFIPLLELLPFNEYLDILGEVDIAVFNHNRQQAMGNIITLLGLGKTVYMRSNVSSYTFFSEIGVSVFDFAYFRLECLPEKQPYSNRERIKDYFSEEKLIRQYLLIFENEKGSIYE